MKPEKRQETLLAKSSDFSSRHVDLEDHQMFSAQINVTNGTLFDGSCTLQVSNDLVSWIDVSGTTSALSGATDVQIYDVIESSAGFARVKIDIVAGSADFNIDWVLK